MSCSKILETLHILCRLKGSVWVALCCGSLFHLPKTCGSVDKCHSSSIHDNVGTPMCVTESEICYETYSVQMTELR